MNLRQMQIFQAIMERGSVTSAAALLNISQPAVSTALRHTEEQLKFLLFMRSAGRLVPTAEAQVLYRSVQEVFERAEKVQLEIEMLRHSRVGVLRIVTIPALGAKLLPSMTGRFLALHPRAQVSLDIKGRRFMVDALQNGGTDLGFGNILPDVAGITRVELKRSPLSCIMHRDHPLAGRKSVTLAEVAQWPNVAINGYGLSPVVRSLFIKARHTPHIVTEVGLMQNAWAMVSEGIGVAVVNPHSDLQALYANVAVVPLDHPFRDTLEVCYAKGRKLSRLASDFIDFTRAQLALTGAPPQH